MFKKKQFNYAVFGNPINNSQSPKIHSFFAKQTKILHNYKAVNAPVSDFDIILYNFFNKYGLGANITAPFKQQAYLLCNKLTERAKIAKSVNTLKRLDDKLIIGDNTDGIGCLSDLMRLDFIKKNDSILIFGAGGAAKGIIFPLLSFGCSIFISNRTLVHAEQLILQFHKYGNIQILNQNTSKIRYFNLIINATSNSVKNIENFIPISLISKNTCFYDMNYKQNNTFFIDWCKKIKANIFSNGIGMLVFQAAHSFSLWHNVFPETNYIIDYLSKEYDYNHVKQLKV